MAVLNLMSQQVQVRGQALTMRFPAELNEVTNHALAGIDYPHLLPEGVEVTTIVDVGSNVGGAAINFAMRYPGARIYCFEPAAEAFELLKGNTGALGIVDCSRLALSDENTMGTLHHGMHHWAQNSLFKSGMAGSVTEIVSVRRASEALEELGLSHISILKIDGEGCEARVLRDLVASRDRFVIDLIQLEYHSEEDRVAIERLLTPDYLLTYSNSTKIHRGRVSYVRKKLYPAELWYRIDARGEGA